MRVVIIRKENGDIESVITDEPCEVFTIADHIPNDRVYRLTKIHIVNRIGIDALMRDDVIGHSEDDRHAAISNRVLSTLEGKPYLRPLK